MTIDNVKAEAKIGPEIYEANPSMYDALDGSLNGRFLSALLYSHELYDLSCPTVTRVDDDGHKSYFLHVGSGRFKVTGGDSDFRMTDKDGNVVADTKQEKKDIAEVSKHVADDNVLALLRSYEDSVRDPNNELLYLYETRDALSRKFGDENAVISALKTISHIEWSWFGKLCNKKHLRQGRHRGKKYSELRNATDYELSKARGIAKAMIEGYLLYLDTSTT